jgi:hypothetical protein
MNLKPKLAVIRNDSCGYRKLEGTTAMTSEFNSNETHGNEAGLLANHLHWETLTSQIEKRAGFETLTNSISDSLDELEAANAHFRTNNSVRKSLDLKKGRRGE